MTGTEKIWIDKNQLRWQFFLIQTFLIAVAIVEDCIEQGSSLRDCCFQPSPLCFVDDEWDGVKGPKPLCATRVAINVVGNRVAADDLLSALPMRTNLMIGSGVFVPIIVIRLVVSTGYCGAVL